MLVCFIRERYIAGMESMMRVLPFFVYNISGNSMMPTFYEGQKVIGWHWFYGLGIGDVVVIKVEDRLLIKRLKKIDEGTFWVEGDNKKYSTDSRSFGWISRKQIIAKVVYQ